MTSCSICRKLVEWRIFGQNELQNEPIGNLITRWIRMLHFGQSFGLAYKIFVSVLGLIITLLSVTGIYIWWKKHRARQRIEQLHSLLKESTA